ncbi:Microtubule binding [Fragilaria crotonensis]|nr:Microtubule binding [Fragilaria crotonensis]
MFGEDSTTEAIYDEMVRPIVWGITNGKHGTVFCYGQTGSGKTFTMQGNDLDVHEEDGLLQLAVKDIFQWIRESNRESMVRISYFEIYNEQVRDLLSGWWMKIPPIRVKMCFKESSGSTP